MEEQLEQIELANTRLKDVMADAKEAGYKPSKLKKVAALRVNGKYNNFVSEVDEITELYEAISNGVSQ
jgi:uncharacterized protein (UPF0335 family)